MYKRQDDLDVAFLAHCGVRPRRILVPELDGYDAALTKALTALDGDEQKLSLIHIMSSGKAEKEAEVRFLGLQDGNLQKHIDNYMLLH